MTDGICPFGPVVSCRIVSGRVGSRWVWQREKEKEMEEEMEKNMEKDLRQVGR